MSIPESEADQFDNMAKELAKWLEGSEREATDVLLYIRAMKLHDDDPEDYRPDWLPEKERLDWAKLDKELAKVHDFVMSAYSTDETFEILVMQLTDTAREVLRFHREGASDKVLAEVWLELVDRHRSYSEGVAQGKLGW